MYHDSIQARYFQNNEYVMLMLYYDSYYIYDLILARYFLNNKYIYTIMILVRWSAIIQILFCPDIFRYHYDSILSKYFDIDIDSRYFGIVSDILIFILILLLILILILIVIVIFWYFASRYFLNHAFLEQAFDQLCDAGFR